MAQTPNASMGADLDEVVVSAKKEKLLTVNDDESRRAQIWPMLKVSLCYQAVTDDALTGALTAADNAGTASDLLQPVAVVGATAAGVAHQLPNMQAWSFLSGELSRALKDAARVGNYATGLLVLNELRRGNAAGAFYAGLDFGLFWALSASAAAGSPVTGGGSAVQAALIGAAFYASGGSQAAVRSVVCH